MMKNAGVLYSEKSEESLNAAKVCFEKGYYNSCVNRSYYAMFQIATALLFKAGHKPNSKKIGHNWVQAEFSRLFIRQNKRFPRLKGFLSLVQRSGDIADYSTEKISRKTAWRILSKADTFTEQVCSEVNKTSLARFNMNFLLVPKLRLGNAVMQKLSGLPWQWHRKPESFSKTGFPSR